MNKIILISFLALSIILPTQADDTWKQPLSVKEQKIEEGIRLKHNILGLYPSQVQIPRDGGPIDITTTNPFADIQHAVCWTANYLAGLSYKYAFLKKHDAPEEQLQDAKERADEVFEAVYRCQRVTGVKGLQARGYFLGHGETYAERRNSTKLPFWRQGQVDGQDFRWVGDPSHHNYSDAIHGLGQYYTLSAEGKQKERARQAIDDLVSYWVDNDLNIDKYDKSLRTVPILGITDGKTLNTRIMMAIAGAKIAHHATGKEKFKAVYERLLQQYGVLDLKTFKTEKGFDDAEHVFCHLDLLFRIEDNPQRLAAFRKVADGLWRHYTNDAQSLFTYIYFNIAPDAPGKENALQDAYFSLQTFPTDMTLKPQMNSLFSDRKPPYPTYLAAWDNEYIWKAHLLRADGWHSRIVTDIAVSPEDPMVIYAAGQAGGLYQGRDGGRTWQNWIPIDQNLTSAVVSVAVGERSRIIAVACHNGFYLSTTAGASWQRLPIPYEGDPKQIAFDSQSSNVLHAISSKGVYRSLDFGEDYLGQSWQSLTDVLPPLDNARFYLAQGDPGRIYAVSAHRIFTRSLMDDEWIRGADFGLGEYAETYPWLAIDPKDPAHLITGYFSDYEAFGALSILQESHDAGQSWTNDMETVFKTISEKGLRGILALGTQGKINELIFDSQQPNQLYAITDRGIMKSQDGGLSWTKHLEGFTIPLARSLFQPQHSEWLFAGTPGGLFISKDQGETWQDGNLWLQFDKNNRRELGGAAFIDAYWRGRYYGFIDDQTASANS